MLLHNFVRTFHSHRDLVRSVRISTWLFETPRHPTIRPEWDVKAIIQQLGSLTGLERVIVSFDKEFADEELPVVMAVVKNRVESSVSRDGVKYIVLGHR